MIFQETGRRFSLSQRERAGVRESLWINGHRSAPLKMSRKHLSRDLLLSRASHRRGLVCTGETPVPLAQRVERDIVGVRHQGERQSLARQITEAGSVRDENVLRSAQSAIGRGPKGFVALRKRQRAGVVDSRSRSW